MKKIVSVLLVAVLLAGFGAIAAAYTDYSALPTVASLEVEWSGEIRLWNGVDLYIFEDEFTVTLHYADETSRVLTEWNSGPTYLWWSVMYLLDHSRRTVTFFYVDTNLTYAFYGRRYIATSMEYTEEFLATLPTTTITFPADFRRLLIDSHNPLPQLYLNQTVMFTQEAIFAFTPQISGLYYLDTNVPSFDFCIPACGCNHPTFLINVLDPDTNIIARFFPNTALHRNIHLTAGSTYYFFTSALNNVEHSISLSLVEEAPLHTTLPPFFQFILRWFFFGWIWM